MQIASFSDSDSDILNNTHQCDNMAHIVRTILAILARSTYTGRLLKYPRSVCVCQCVHVHHCICLLLTCEGEGNAIQC